MEEPPKKKFEDVRDAMDKKRKMARRSRDSDSESPVPDSADKTTTAGSNETLHEFSTAASSDMMSRPGRHFCLLCEKETTPGHLDSGPHKLKKEEDAVGTRMAGKASSTRKLTGGELGSGYLGSITKKGMLKYWGDDILLSM